MGHAPKKVLKRYSGLNSYHEFMTPMEIAQFEGKSLSTIHNWFKADGKIKPNYGKWGGSRNTMPPSFIAASKRDPFSKKNRIKDVPIITDPKIYDNHDFLYDCYVNKRYSEKVIERMTGLCHIKVHFLLRKHKIPKRTTAEACKSKNPCCTKEWLTEHYVLQNIPAIKCAKLANVYPYTIHKWLVKFQISIRNNSEAQTGELHFAYGKTQPYLQAGFQRYKEARKRNLNYGGNKEYKFKTGMFTPPDAQTIQRPIS